MKVRDLIKMLQALNDPDAQAVTEIGPLEVREVLNVTRLWLRPVPNTQGEYLYRHRRHVKYKHTIPAYLIK